MRELLFVMVLVLSASDAAAQHPWPVEPFDQAHDITGVFCEYRDTGSAPHFHDAVDIPKPDRSPVYSVVDGRVTGIGADWVRVDEFAYVHVEPAPGLSVGDSAFATQSIVGTVMAGYGHVHFKDGQPGSERQPLRSDGLQPFVDDWAPRIADVRFYSQPTRERLGSQSLAGLVEITFQVADPGGPPSSNESRQNNGGYIVGFQVLTADRQAVVYDPTGADGVVFRFDVIPSDAYVHNVFDPLQSSTAEHTYIVTNRLTSRPGWDVSQLDEGEYTVMLFAEDTEGNRAEHFVDVAVEHRDIIPPPPPTLDAIVGSELHWRGGEAADLAGYRVYGSATPQGPWTFEEILNPAARSSTAVSDEARYFYVSAIDTASVVNESVQTDIYGFAPDPHGRRLLVVDGFDRFGGSGSWHLAWHRFGGAWGSAIAANGFGFETAANEAVTSGDVDLRDYDAVFWLLGDESTADETFSVAEQARVRAYLEEGGRLLVSGSEIAWDLDNRGSTADRAFMRDYLKVAYAGDDANSLSVTGAGTFDLVAFNYGASPYNEDYPDYFTPAGGSVPVLHYSNGRVAGVQYEGVFGEGSAAGKLVVMGFPFETIAGTARQEAVMGRVLGFFFPEYVSTEDAMVPVGPRLSPPYPNPASAYSNVEVELGDATHVTVAVYDMLGRRIATLVDGVKPPGRHMLTWRPDVAAGVYFVRMEAGGGATSVQRVVVAPNPR